MADTEPSCPNADQHTPQPIGYLNWHHWAARMARTHTQLRCPGCDLYKIWIPKVARAQATTEEKTDEA